MTRLLRLQNNEPVEYRNSEYIPAFLLLPAEIMACEPIEFRSISCNVQKLLRDPKTIAQVESDVFLLGIILGYSLLVWPAMGQKCTPESYSQNEPATLLSRTPSYWITMLEDAGILLDAWEWLQVFTGCAVNFKSTTVSYKVHKTVYKPEEDWQIIPNMQEPIIDENTWLRVQEPRQNKRRNAKTGRVSLFSGLLFCPDCGAKLHFCAAKSLKPNQEFYRCANYKDGRGSCKIHYIRNVVLEQIVLTEISELADFVRCYEPIFLYLISRKTETAKKTELNAMRQRLSVASSRITEIDRVISRLYEDNILGKISDERFSKMSATYEAEQKALETEAAEIEQKLRDADKASVDLRMLLKGLREFTELKKLTPELVNTLIQRIEVHNSDRSGGKNTVKVDIYFTAAGMIDLPTEKELEKLISEFQRDHSKVTA